MRKFDTNVQQIKYKVLLEVSKHEFNSTLLQNITNIPKKIIPGKHQTMRCCVYKERAIISERLKLAIGGDLNNPNVVEVIDIACDECPEGGHTISFACRGCIAHRCSEVCPKDAIIFDQNQKAHIDKAKCIECGLCAKVCPFKAIQNYKRPCEQACKINAISMSETKAAKIDNDKCIACGACVYQCPFGAVMDKSFMTDVIAMLKQSENNTKYKVYAVVAPSISSQFTYAKLSQVVTAIKKLGFFHVVEAALGADIVAYEEAKELAEKGFLTSSCCPAFVDYIHKEFPQLVDKISHNLSPMATIAKQIKKSDPNCKIIFIGPCTAKKAEFQKDSVKPYIDSVLTFEELQAMIDSQNIDISNLEEEELDNASYYGRIFARSGGLSDAVLQALKEQNITDFELKPSTCDGIEACRIALIKASKGVLKENFIEGMACISGCIGGAGCLTHGAKDKSEIDKYGKLAYEKTITDAISILNIT